VTIPPLLHSLLSATAPSGREGTAAQVWRGGCEGFADEVGADTVGSSYARVGGRAQGRSLMLVGHIDEIGLHVTHIEDGGFLRFGEVGGWDPIVLVGQRIRVVTRSGPIAGVIARKPIHLMKGEEREKMPQLKDLHIDIGAKDGDEARELVAIGDVAVIDAGPLELRHDRVVARALDNRVGCFVVAEAARLVAAGERPAGDLTAVAVAQEETSFGGSRTSAFHHDPQVAVVVDLTFSTDQPGIELGALTKHELGSGPVIARGTTLHPLVADWLIEAAEAEKIPFTVESLGRATGTDADAIHLSRAGVPTGLVSVPCRYMHSPVEMVSLGDIDAAARLLAAFARRLPADASFLR